MSGGGGGGCGGGGGGVIFFFFFKQKTAYEIKECDWSSDVCSSDLYGGPVPSVAEFIANSWDADAKKVDITIPEDITKPDAEIIIRDFGEGMLFEEINEYYLTIGYERRLSRGERTTSGRLVMGRKGIGKLAGFGIAEDITIRSIKNGYLTQFNMNYEVLKSKKQMEGYEFSPDIDEKSDEETGVYVIDRKSVV